MDLGQLTHKVLIQRCKINNNKAAVSHKDAYDPIASQSFILIAKVFVQAI